MSRAAGAPARAQRGHLVILAGLYLAQGVPYGFFTQVLPVALRKAGTSLEAIGLASALALPWSLKAIWAPWVERTSTPRRWILGLQAAAVALAVALAALDPMSAGGGALRGLALAVFLTNLIAATQDVPTDGLAVRLLDGASRGLGNGVQVGAYRAGMILGGGVLLVAWEALGWRAAMLAMAVTLALASAPLGLAPAVGAEPVPARPERAHPWDWVAREGAWRWLVVLGVYKLGDHLAQGMIRPWLVDVGYSEGDIGALLGLGGFFAGLVGALGGGWAVPRLGLGAALVGFSTLQVTGPLAYALAAAVGPSWPVVAAAAAWEHLVGGMATAALFTAMMEASRPTDAATDYTLQASVVVLASGVGAALSGLVAAHLGYFGTFLIAGALAVLAPLVVARPAMRRVLA